jgi:predicted dinucleotide-binding enzyme
MGRGLAIRWALKHDVLIGSRSSDRASEIAKEQENIARGYYQAEMKGSIKGKYNIDAAKESEIVVMALPPAAVIETTTDLRTWLQPNQILISTVVSMKKSKGLFYPHPDSKRKFEEIPRKVCSRSNPRNSKAHAGRFSFPDRTSNLLEQS